MSFADFKNRTSEPGGFTAFRESLTGSKEEQSEGPNFTVFGLNDLGVSQSTPQFTETSSFEEFSKIGKGTFQAFRALTSAGREGEAFREGFTSGTLQAASSVETTLSRGFARLADTDEDFLPRPKMVVDFFDSASRKFKDLAQKDIRLAESLQAEVEQPDRFADAIRDPEYIARGVGQNLPNLLAAFGVATPVLLATKNPVAAGAAAFGPTFALEFGFAYQDAEKFGLDPEEADKLAFYVGTANGILDTLPIGNALSKIPQGKQIKNNLLRRISKDIGKQMLLEGSTESLQEVVANAVAQSYDENRGLLEGVPEAAFFGLLLGGGTTVATHVGSGGVRGLEIEDVSLDALANERDDLVVVATDRTFEGKPVKSVPTEALIGEDLAGVKAEDEGRIQFWKEKIEAGEKIDPLIVQVSDGNIFTEDGKHRLEAYRQLNTEIVDVIQIPVNKREVQETPQETTQKDVDVVLADIEAELDFAEPGGKLFDTEDGGKARTPGVYPAFLPEDLRSGANLRIAEDILAGKEPAGSKQKKIQQAIINFVAERVGQERYSDLEFTQLLEKMEVDAKTKHLEFTKKLVANLKKKRKSLTSTQTKRAIRDITKPNSPLVVRREMTLLKDKLKNLSRGAREGTRVTKAEVKKTQGEVLEVLEKSDLSPKDRDKFRRFVKNIQTPKQFEENLPDMLRRVGELSDKAEKRAHLSRAGKLLKQTKTKKRGGKPVGRLTPEIQESLDFIRSVAGLSQDEVTVRITENLSKLDATFPDEALVRQNVFLDTFGGLKEKNTQEVARAASLIQDMIEQGRLSAELAKFNRSEEMVRVRNKVIDVVTGGKGLPKGVKTSGIKRATQESRRKHVAAYLGSIGKSIVGWKDVLDMLSTLDDSAPYKSFLNRWGEVINEQRAERGGLFEQTQVVRDLVKDAYGLSTDREVVKKLHELFEEVELGTFTNSEGVSVDIVFTRDELIKRYMELKDTTLNETFTEGMAYTNEIVEAINTNMTNEDIVFAESQLIFYQKYYDRVNEVYREMYGVNLPQNQNYSPIKREGVAEKESGYGEFMQDIVGRATVSNASLKSRVKNVHPIARRGSTSVLQTHITHMEHFMAWAEKIRDFQSVFNDARVRTAIKSNHGRDVLGVVDGFVDDMARGSDARAFQVGVWDKLRGRFSRAVLAVKPAIFVKQLTSFIAYADAMPVGQFTAGQVHFWTNPVKHGKFLKKNSTMLKTRGQNIERDLAVALKSDEYNFFREKASFLNSLTLNIKAGDQGAIMAGGWSVYKFHHDEAIKAGKTEEQAIEIGIAEFEKVTESTQQSSELAELSQFQRGGSIAKLLTMFKSAPNQYFRKELGAIRNAIAGRGDTSQHIKTIVIFHFMLPMLFQYVSDMFRFNKEHQARAAILGAFNGVFIAGDMLQEIIDVSVGAKNFPSEIAISGIKDDIIKGIRVFSADDVSTEDFIGGLRAVAGTTGSLTGAPLKQVVDMGDALKKVFEGDYEVGLGQFLGWSPFIVEQAFKEEDDPFNRELKKKPKKKKKKQLRQK